MRTGSRFSPGYAHAAAGKHVTSSSGWSADDPDPGRRHPAAPGLDPSAELIVAVGTGEAAEQLPGDALLWRSTPSPSAFGHR